MKKTTPKNNFGYRMWALRKAREESRKEQQDTKDHFSPIDPLETQVKASLINKPLVASAQVPNENQQIEVKVSTAMERAIQHLREQATKIK